MSKRFFSNKMTSTRLLMISNPKMKKQLEIWIVNNRSLLRLINWSLSSSQIKNKSTKNKLQLLNQSFRAKMLN